MFTIFLGVSSHVPEPYRSGNLMCLFGRVVISNVTVDGFASGLTSLGLVSSSSRESCKKEIFVFKFYRHFSAFRTYILAVVFGRVRVLVCLQ